MTLALDDVLAVETRETVFADILSVADDLMLKITSWQPGQPLRSALAYVSQKIADVQVQNREAIAGGLLDFGKGAWLTLLAQSLYRVTRQPATFGTLDNYSYQNTGPANAVFAAGDLIVAHRVTGKTYHNLVDISIAPATTKSDIAIIADEAGTASNAGPGEIDQLVSVKVGGVVTNVSALLAADDEEDDPLRDRCRAKLGSLSPNGPKEAYLFVTTTQFFEDGTPCCVTSTPLTRCNPVLDVDTGLLACYIATSVGAPSSDDVAIADKAIDKWCTPWLGRGAQAIAATELVEAVTYALWIKSNLTTAQIQSTIAIALANYFKTIPIGGEKIEPDDNGVLYTNALEVVIATALGGIVRLQVSGPSGDVVMTPDQVAKLGTVTGTIHVVT